MLKSLSDKSQLLVLVLITMITRIPFIFDGYGVEEDSWGLVVNAYEMHSNGHYVASRFPGHPLQEYIYFLIYDAPAWLYNSLSLIASIIAVAYFFKALKKIQLQGAFYIALLFCLTPVFYIAGTYTIDFAWTIAFVMCSFYFLLNRKFIMCGIMLGMAMGCRLTIAIFLLPWLILIWSNIDWKTAIKDFVKIIIPTLLIGFLWFIPAYLNYGWTFFDYSDQFPYPPIAKIIYKATIGVYGLIGILLIGCYKLLGLNNWRKKQLNSVTLFSSERLLLVCYLVIVLHVISYLKLPQKAGYLIPTIPFMMVTLGLTLKSKQLRLATILFLTSPFLLSINLTDRLRGSTYSSMAMKFQISGQEFFVDPLSGPIFSEQSKRINKMKYCKRVMKKINKEEKKSVLICGWWYNELAVANLKRKHKRIIKNHATKLEFYSPCLQMNDAKQNGFEIFYLPEQNLFNDQMFNQNCTDNIAKPFALIE